MVFLNGCSTKGQVERLLQLGIKAVVATSASVEDDKATAFAEYFYKKLANGGSLQQSFSYALDSLQFEQGAMPGPQLYGPGQSRSISLEGLGQEDAPPWGLYYQDEEALKWTLPYSLSFPGSDLAEKSSYEPNEYIYPILGEMAAYDSRLEEDIRDLEDDREFLELIIKNFPWNIGSQIGKLVSNDTEMLRLGTARLEQAVNTYIAAAQFIFFATLSQVWNEKNTGGIWLLPGRSLYLYKKQQ